MWPKENNTHYSDVRIGENLLLDLYLSYRTCILNTSDLNLPTDDPNFLVSNPNYTEFSVVFNNNTQSPVTNPVFILAPPRSNVCLQKYNKDGWLGATCFYLFPDSQGDVTSRGRDVT